MPVKQSNVFRKGKTLEQYSKSRTMAALVGCTLILATGIGSTSIMNAVLPEIVAGVGCDLTTFMVGPMVATIAAFLAGLVGAKVIDLLTPKWALMLGTVCVTVVMALVGFATSLPVWILANLINGIVLAFGAYASVAGVVAEFKGAKTQQVFGIVSGAAALVISAEVALAGALLNMMSYREVFYIFAVITLVVGTFSNLVLVGKMPSRKELAARKQAAAEAQKSQAQSGEGKVPSGLTLKEALKSPALYLFLLAMFFGSWALNGVTTYLSVFLTSFNLTTAEAAGFASILGVFIAVIKFGSGWFIKKFGTKALAAAIGISFGVGIGLMLFWTQSGISALVYVGLLLAAMIGFVTILPGLFISDIFGMKDYTGLNSLGMAVFYLGTATLTIGFAAIIANAGIVSAYAVLIACGVISMVCLFAALVISPVKKMAQKNPEQA